MPYSLRLADWMIKEVLVNGSWLPTYSADGKAYRYAEELKDIKAFYQDANGVQYLGTKAGLSGTIAFT
jgi:hypothetical protein